MPLTSVIRPMVEKYSRLPLTRLRVLSKFEDVKFSTIHRGIIFVFATWSGLAVKALQLFTQAVAQLPPNALDLVVLDIDCLTEDTFILLFGNTNFRVGGYGETIWVKDGIVLAREAGSSAYELLVLAHTKKLFED